MHLAALPKAELHCHLEGIVDPPMARAILQEDPSFPVDPEVLEAVTPADSFEGFWNWFAPNQGLYRQQRYYEAVITAHVARLRAQKVCYAEIMIGGGSPPRETAPLVANFQNYYRWAKAAEAGEIQVELLLTIGRHNSLEDIATWGGYGLELYRQGLIVGVAIAGPEEGHPVAPFQPTLARFKEAGMGIEIHAGEWSGPESVWDALRHGYPDRIGHGVTLFQDPALIEAVLERNIHLEMCPTSNLCTGSISDLAEHPISRARELNMSYSVNTDDPGAFGCSITSEYQLLVDRFGFSQQDLEQITDNALAAGFAVKDRPRRAYGETP